MEKLRYNSMHILSWQLWEGEEPPQCTLDRRSVISKSEVLKLEIEGRGSDLS
jgi:hypothetical protein